MTMTDQIPAERQRVLDRATGLLEQSEAVGQEYRQRVADIEADETLADAFRAEQVDRVRQEGAAKRAELGDQYRTLISDRYNTVRTSLCAPPPSTSSLEAVTTATSYRDALQRAASTSPGSRALDELVSLAQSTGDSLLERATLVVAMERGESRIVEQWAERHPADADRLDELHDLHAELHDTARTFTRALNFV